jgi:two-component system, OmpR family, aerobic respiration control sensor histidine kinase ArcB
MFGLNSLDAFIGLTFEEMGKIGNWSPAVTQTFKEETLEVIKTGKAILNREEPPIRHANGEIIYFLTSRVPLFDNQGKVIGIIGISVDIGDLKKMEFGPRIAKEEAEKSNQSKTEFLENMRHDLRTPLTGVISAAELLKNEGNKEIITQYADRIISSSKELLNFLNEILESVNVATGKVPLLKKRFDLKVILEQVINLNQTKAIAQQLDLKFNFDDNIPSYLIGDATRIYRIVLELLGNALKFTHEGMVAVSAKLYKKNARDIVVAIEIADTGIGISEEEQQKLFLRFTRLTPSYEGIYKGSGLGLSIIKQFIDDMQGEIYVSSNGHGLGSKFTCFIPCQESLVDREYDNGAEDSAFTTVSTSVLQANSHVVCEAPKLNSSITHSILLVEDQPMIGEFTKTLLSKLSCTVDIAPKGNIAIELAKKNNYDLIFMDIGLPDISGYEVTNCIRQYEKTKGTSRVPIIALTAHADEKSQQDCLKLGIDSLIIKPLMQEVAINTLNKFIPHKEKITDHDDLAHQHAISPPVAEMHIIDFEAMKKLTNNKPNLMHEMMEMFVASLPIEIESMQKIYQQQDWESLRSIAHTLNGGSCYCGAMRLQNAAKNLEIYINSGEKFDDNLHKLYQNMLHETKAIVNFWQQYDMTQLK